MGTDGGRAPVLVLGIGNTLLADDGVGLEVLELLRPELADDPRIELVDGGTQGLMLLGLLEGRQSLLLLDAIQLGAAPGHVHHVSAAQRLSFPRGTGAHAGNASELLDAAHLLGSLPARVELVGVEPSDLSTRVGLSPVVDAALPAALAVARSELEQLLADLERPPTRRFVPCTS